MQNERNNWCYSSMKTNTSPCGCETDVAAASMRGLAITWSGVPPRSTDLVMHSTTTQMTAICTVPITAAMSTYWKRTGPGTTYSTL